MEKDFTGWHQLKTQLQAEHCAPTFQQREIWWGCIGLNLGHEMDGKGQSYQRPVLIVRKFNPHIFYGVPLTTDPNQGKPILFPHKF
jgi:mRNA interferase MazF